MTPFFRRIRMKLAAENKFGKYLRYAIGEIILVVIGILIAIQLNTWRKEVQSHKMEKTYLTNLKNDLLIQLEINQEQIDFETIKMQEVDSALFYIEDKIDSGTFFQLIDELSRRHTMVSNMVSFEMMLETGNANNIRNADILEALVRYKQLLDYVTLVVNNNNIHLIDGQFGQFANGNEIGFSYGPNGEIYLKETIDEQKRFLIYTRLKKRKVFSSSNKIIVERLNDATSELVEQIEGYLREEV